MTAIKYCLKACSLLLLLFFLSLNTLTCTAQNEGETSSGVKTPPSVQKEREQQTEYLLENRKIKVTAFGGPFFQFGKADGDLGIYIGAGGAVLLNKSVFIGVYGGTLAGEFRREVITDSLSFGTRTISFGQAGLWLGYINNSPKLLHWGISAKIGLGSLGIDELNGNAFIDVADPVVVISPQFDVELNINHWFKLGFNLGYMLVTDIDEHVLGFRSGDFNTPTGGFSLLFGRF